MKLKLTKKEKEFLIEELSEKMKDVVYMNSRRRAKELVDKLQEMNLEPESKLEITYKIVFVFNDILQIVARVRRCKDLKTVN